MSWRRYAAERVLASAAWVVVVVLVVFVTYRVLAPVPEFALAPRAEAPERFDVVAEYFADDPALVRLYDFVRRLGGGSLGESFLTGDDVTNRVVTAAPVTLSVVVGAIVIALAIAIPLGFIWSGRRLRGVSAVVHLALALMPAWFALTLSFYVGFRAELTPISGYCDFFSPPRGNACGGPVDWARQLILPWTTLAIPLAALYVRIVRVLVTDVRGVVAAAVPTDRRRVLARARRAAAATLAKHAGRDVGVLLGLTVFIEPGFNLPGLGLLLFDSIVISDYPLGEAVLLLAAGIALAAHLTADLVVAAVAPEARTT